MLHPRSAASRGPSGATSHPVLVPPGSSDTSLHAGVAEDGPKRHPDPGHPRGDRELLEALRGGDQSALAVLLRRHWVPIVNYAARMLESADAAEDVAQEVFVRIWQYRWRWTPTGSPSAYLYSIARNLVLKRLRHHAVHTRTAEQIRENMPVVVTPFQHAASVELSETFDRALKSLPVRRREAFILLRYQGLSLREAAKVMGVSPQTVANHATLAALELRQRLECHAP
ncbi:MAG: sigma-70 family RNA polymerase sigma factor [Gemmatimonadetes bacterium]|nr:sigma-70 family RNA polymerase sigma factor [Gemmatimonadota bacterium]